MTPGGMFRWFQDQDNWTGEVGWLPSPGTATTDKAKRFKHCIANQPGNTVRVTQESSQGTRTFDLPGQIPQDATRVVFQDDNYDPVKDERYDENVLTWHWDNIEVFAEGTSEVPEPPRHRVCPGGCLAIRHRPIRRRPAARTRLPRPRKRFHPPSTAWSATVDAPVASLRSASWAWCWSPRPSYVGFLLGRTTRRGAPPPPAPAQDPGCLRAESSEF